MILSASARDDRLGSPRRHPGRHRLRQRRRPGARQRRCRAAAPRSSCAPGRSKSRRASGSYTVRAGNYLLARATRSRRSPGAASRATGSTSGPPTVSRSTYDSPQNASSQYVGDDYSGDVQSLDGYGDWEYNSTYSSQRLAPDRLGRLDSLLLRQLVLHATSACPGGRGTPGAGIPTTTATGSSTPAGTAGAGLPATSTRRPGSTGATRARYLGWCPTGYYGGYSPWWNSYYKNWTYPRGSLAFAINGRFYTRQVDLRGWNFTDASQRRRPAAGLDVVPGTRVVDRLGSDFSVSSRPIVLADRGRGGVREGLRDYIREAPRVIERTSGRDSERLAPVLARESTLAARHRGRPARPRGRRGARAALGPRRQRPGSERSGGRRARIRARPDRAVQRGETGRTVITDRRNLGDRGPGAPSHRPAAAGQPGAEARARRPAKDATVRAPRDLAASGRATRAARARLRPPLPRDGAASRPGRLARGAAPRSESFERDASRARPNGAAPTGGPARVPPARRVIEGAVPGRRAPRSDPADAPRYRERDGRFAGRLAPQLRTARRRRATMRRGAARAARRASTRRGTRRLATRLPASTPRDRAPLERARGPGAAPGASAGRSAIGPSGAASGAAPRAAPPPRIRDGRPAVPDVS